MNDNRTKDSLRYLISSVLKNFHQLVYFSRALITKKDPCPRIQGIQWRLGEFCWVKKGSDWVMHQTHRTGIEFRDFKAVSVLSEDPEEQRESVTCLRSCRSRWTNGPQSHFSVMTSNKGRISSPPSLSLSLSRVPCKHLIYTLILCIQYKTLVVVINDIDWIQASFLNNFLINVF